MSLTSVVVLQASQPTQLQYLIASLDGRQLSAQRPVFNHERPYRAEVDSGSAEARGFEDAGRGSGQRGGRQGES